MSRTNKIFATIILLIISIIVLLAVSKVFFEKYHPTAKLSESPQETTLSADNGKIVISTDQGNVSVNNVFENPIAEFDGVSFKETSGYQLLYFPDTQMFNITILNPDLQRTRDEAEANFLRTLGISEEDACKLNVNLQVFFQVSEKAAGKNFGLSFCPNGKPLPAE